MSAPIRVADIKHWLVVPNAQRLSFTPAPPSAWERLVCWAIGHEPAAALEVTLEVRAAGAVSSTTTAVETDPPLCARCRRALPPVTPPATNEDTQ